MSQELSMSCDRSYRTVGEHQETLMDLATDIPGLRVSKPRQQPSYFSVDGDNSGAAIGKPDGKCERLNDCRRQCAFPFLVKLASFSIRKQLDAVVAAV
jgi:hypothetical protein